MRQVRTRHRLAPMAGVVAVAATLALSAAPGAGAGASGPSAAAKSQAKKTLLVLSDLPKGWKSTKNNDTGSGNFPGAAQLAGCIGVPASLIDGNPPKVDSPEFDSKDGTLEVDDTVSIFPSAANARAEYAAISNTKTASCMSNLMNGSFKQSIEASGGQGVAVGTISVANAPSPKHTTAFALSLPITTQGVSVTATLRIVYFLKGNLGQQLTFSAYGPPFPTSLENHLISVAIKRI